MTGWVLHVGTMPASSSSSDTVASHAESNSRDAQHSTRPQPAVGTRRYNAAHCTDNRPPRYYACFSGSLDLLQTNAGLLKVNFWKQLGKEFFMADSSRV